VRHRGRLPRPNAQLERRLASAEAALTAYRDHPTLLRTLGPARFDDGLRVRMDRVDRCALAVANDRAHVAATRGQQRGAEDWIALWPEISVTERREAIAELIECVFIDEGTEPLAERAWVCPRGQARASRLGLTASARSASHWSQEPPRRPH
jgi:hypothetical protein